MGTWGAGALDNDAGWDLVTRLAQAPPDVRGEVLTHALDPAGTLDPAGRAWDVDDAAAAVAAALLVAMARSPKHFPGDRNRVLDQASRLGDRPGEVLTFPDLVGDWRQVRSPATARRALAALDRAAHDSELTALWAGDGDGDGAGDGDGHVDRGFADAIEEIRRCLQARTAAWPASALSAQAGPARPVHKTFAPGDVLMLDLGDGSRGYAVYREHSFVTCLSTQQPVGARPLSPGQVLALPVAFTMGFNDYQDAPPGWTAIGSVADSSMADGDPAGRHTADDVFGPLPVTFMQDVAHPHDCQLIWPGFTQRAPATQQECIGLERYGVAWYPSSVEDRLRCHLAGVPHPGTEALRVHLSRSLFCVVTREQAEAAQAEWRFPAGIDRGTYHPYYDLDLVAEQAATHGAGRRDLVVVELDAAVFEHHDVDRRPLDPGDPQSPPVLWVRCVSPLAVLAVHDLEPDDGDGWGYRPVAPIHPRYPG